MASGLIRDLIEWRPPLRKTIGELLGTPRRTANDVVTWRAQMSAKERRELRTDISALEIGLIDARERP